MQPERNLAQQCYAELMEGIGMCSHDPWGAWTRTRRASTPRDNLTLPLRSSLLKSRAATAKEKQLWCVLGMTGNNNIYMFP